jgi:hypothetical protein
MRLFPSIHLIHPQLSIPQIHLLAAERSTHRIELALQ